MPAELTAKVEQEGSWVQLLKLGGTTEADCSCPMFRTGASFFIIRNYY